MQMMVQQYGDHPQLYFIKILYLLVVYLVVHCIVILILLKLYKSKIDVKLTGMINDWIRLEYEVIRYSPDTKLPGMLLTKFRT